MTESDGLRIIAMLRRAYPRHELSPDTIEIYVTMIADLEVIACQEAVKRLLVKSKWFPAISEIRSEVMEAETLGLPETEIAWGEVQKAISLWGHTGIPEFSCAEVANAVDVIGWRTICLDENVMSTRARFTDAYRAIRKRTTNDIQLGPHSLESHRPERTRLPERRGYQRLTPWAGDHHEPHGDPDDPAVIDGHSERMIDDPAVIDGYGAEDDT